MLTVERLGRSRRPRFHQVQRATAVPASGVSRSNTSPRGGRQHLPPFGDPVDPLCPRALSFTPLTETVPMAASARPPPNKSHPVWIVHAQDEKMYAGKPSVRRCRCKCHPCVPNFLRRSEALPPANPRRYLFQQRMILTMIVRALDHRSIDIDRLSTTK